MVSFGGTKCHHWGMLFGVILNKKNHDRHLRGVAMQNDGHFKMEAQLCTKKSKISTDIGPISKICFPSER